MKLTAYYDPAGNIVGLAISPSDEAVTAEVMTATHPRLHAAAVDLPEGVAFDFTDPARIRSGLENLATKYRFDRGALRKKS